MKLKKNIRQYIKIALSAGLLAFPSCNYLDVIPPAQPDFDDTMKDESATLGFLFTAYSGTSLYTFWREGVEMLRWPPMNMSSRKTGTGICRKCCTEPFQRPMISVTGRICITTLDMSTTFWNSWIV